METQKQIQTKYGVLRGIVHITDIPKPKGIVIIIHGYFSSQKIGPAKLYVQLARLFAEIGYCVYRFDALGVGDSDGMYSALTFESHRRDMLSVISEIENSKQCNENIILCGHSSGCNVALSIVSSLKNIDKIILISPALGPFSGIEKILSDSQIIELKNGNTVFRKGLPINNNYIEAIQNVDILFNGNASALPSYIFFGESDQFYNIDYLNNYLCHFKNYKSFIIDNADHNFLNPNSRIKLFDILKKHLK